MKKFASSIFNIVSIAGAVLMYIFLSQPYFTWEIPGGFIEGKLDLSSGYELIQNFIDSNDSKSVMVAVSLIILTIFAAIIILCSLVNLLSNMNVIKNKKICKYSNYVNIASAVLMFIFVAIGFFIMVDMVNTDIDTGMKVAWAAILNLIIAFAMVVTTILAYKFADNKKKKR